MKSVFISYKSEDLARAQRICRYFDWAGIKYWIDDEGINLGEQYDKIIPEVIPQYDVVLLLVSQGSLESENVTNEIRIAKLYNKTIIPLMLEETKLEGALLYHVPSNNRIEAYKDWESAVDRLIVRLKNDNSDSKAEREIPKQKPAYGQASAESKDDQKHGSLIHVQCPHCQSTILKESESFWNAFIVDKRFAIMLIILVWILSALLLWAIPESDVYVANTISRMKLETTDPVMLQLLDIEPVAKGITFVIWGFIPVIFMLVARFAGQKNKATTETLTYHCVQCDRRFSLSIPKGKRDLYHVENLIKATAPDRIQRMIEEVKKF